MTTNDNVASKLFIGNLSYDTTEEQLTALFTSLSSNVGKVKIMTRKVYTRATPQSISDAAEEAEHSSEDHKKPKKQISLKSMGFGFIEYESAKVAGEVLAKTTAGLELNGRELKVDFATPKEEKAVKAPKEPKKVAQAENGESPKKAAAAATKKKSVKKTAEKTEEQLEPTGPSEAGAYISNLSWNTTPEQLQAFFTNAGFKATEADIKYSIFRRRRGPAGAEGGAAEAEQQQEPLKRSKGFGFVEFISGAERDKAVAALNGKELDGREVSVRVSNAKRVYADKE